MPSFGAQKLLDKAGRQVGGGYREYSERIRCSGQPCPDPETQGLWREVGDKCGLWFFTHLQRSLGLSPTSPPAPQSCLVCSPIIRL